jgi:hypothetical protein
LTRHRKAAPGRRDRLAAGLMVVAGLALFAGCAVESAAALQTFLAISRTQSAGDRVEHSQDQLTLEDLSLRQTPELAEAQDLFLLAWNKTRLLTLRDPAEVNAAVLASAAQDAEQIIAGAPGYSAGWLLLADLRRAAGAPGSDVARLLKTAILTAPFEPDRVATRLTIGFAIYPSLDADTRDLLASQIQMAWRHAPEDLVHLARTPDRVDRLLIVRLALATDPPSLAAFEKLLGRLR